MKYILIAVFSYGYGTTVAVEFNSEQACLEAIQTIQKRTDDVLKTGKFFDTRNTPVLTVRDAICVPKG